MVIKFYVEEEQERMEKYTIELCCDYKAFKHYAIYILEWLNYIKKCFLLPNYVSKTQIVKFLFSLKENINTF